MKLLTALLFASLTLLAPPMRGGEFVEPSIKVEQEVPFWEFQVRAFATWEEADGGGWGGGASVFPSESWGIGVDYDYGDGGVHSAYVGLIYRLPNRGFEPYVTAGGGLVSGGGTEGAIFGGIGANYWMNDVLGLFVEGRYTYVGSDDPEIGVRAGVAISF